MCEIILFNNLIWCLHISVTSIIYAVILRMSFVGFLRFSLWSIFIDCIGLGAVVASVAWWVCVCIYIINIVSSSSIWQAKGKANSSKTLPSEVFDNHQMIHACCYDKCHHHCSDVSLQLKWVLLIIFLQVCCKQVFFDIIRWSGWVGLLLWRTSQCILPVTCDITRPRCHHIWYV